MQSKIKPRNSQPVIFENKQKRFYPDTNIPWTKPAEYLCVRLDQQLTFNKHCLCNRV